jgi:hypothetical protein
MCESEDAQTQAADVLQALLDAASALPPPHTSNAPSSESEEGEGEDEDKGRTAAARAKAVNAEAAQTALRGIPAVDNAAFDLPSQLARLAALPGFQAAHAEKVCAASQGAPWLLLKHNYAFVPRV